MKPVVPFDEAYGRRVERALGGATVTVASIEDIIRLKTGTGRQKDEADILALDSSRVLRQYREPRDVEIEARAMEHARAHGVPVPAILVAGRSSEVIGKSNIEAAAMTNTSRS